MNSGSSTGKYSPDQIEQLEQELFELENYISDLWEAFPIAMAYVNPLGIVMDADKALAGFLGCDRVDIIGNRLDAYLTDQPALAKLYQETLARGSVSNWEGVLRKANGQAVPVSLATMARKDPAGENIGYFITFSDLTTIKDFQAQLENNLSELKQFNDLAVGRELRMIELEKEVDELLGKLGQPPRYSRIRNEKSDK
jgi:PAS domain S-box-containing protein